MTGALTMTEKRFIARLFLSKNLRAGGTARRGSKQFKRLRVLEVAERRARALGYVMSVQGTDIIIAHKAASPASPLDLKALPFAFAKR